MSDAVERVLKLVNEFETNEGRRPRILIATSNFFQNWWFIIFPAIGGGIWGYDASRAETQDGATTFFPVH